MPSTHRHDRRLVRRMLAGDERAFAELFDSRFPVLYRFALARLRDASGAEEVAQAAMCQAVRKLHTYRGEAALSTWLITFCRHELSAHLRRQERVPEPLGLVDDLPEVRSVLEALAGDDAGPDVELGRRELARWVQTALDHLPPHYGQALEWKYLEELPVREIARRLGLGPKAAESLLTRARAAFRDAFAALDASACRAAETAAEPWR